MTVNADPLPQPAPGVAPVPEPVDTPYPGTIALAVDVSDVARRIFRAKVTIPVTPGPMTLIYAKWLPGFHAPQAPIELLAGLEIRAGGRGLGWVRHPVAVNAFGIEIPEGIDCIEASYQFLSPTQPKHGRVLVTEDMLMLPWNTVTLYPAGHFARRIVVEPSLTLPADWRIACALDQAGRDGATVRFAPVALDVLIDSPVLAARHLVTIPLDDDGTVRLNVAADRPELLDISADKIGPHKGVVDQCDKLFGARHFAHFDVLLGLSEELGTAGIEHHQSCEAVSLPDYFTDWHRVFPRRDTFPHEYVHSWNGKHRRGADSWQPCFERPILNSLMWVYEGQTQYWSQVLAARSGMWTAEQALGALAQTAATFDLRPGSRWRPMIDTTRDPVIAARAPLPWKSWQRSEDYYSEGALLWLDVDTRLRELTGDVRSLDDFAKAFFGADDGVPVTHTYVFEDVVAVLDGIAAYDWKALFAHLVTDTHRHAPLDGVTRGGYRLVYRGQPNVHAAASEGLSGLADHSFSIGLTVDRSGEVADVLWEGPAFDQGMTSGTTIVAVDGRAFQPDILRDAIAATAGGTPLILTIRAGQRVREVRIDYAGGLRHPHLERIDGTPARLDAILAPR